MKILALHGYRQNAQIFYKQTAVLRKELKKVAELVYLDGPMILPSDAEQEQEAEQEMKRGWWAGLNKDGQLNGLEESLSLISSLIKDFDGIIGFSQGGILAFIHALQQPQTIKFIIIVSGFVPTTKNYTSILKASVLQEMSENKFEGLFNDLVIDLPSLHVYGLCDDIVHPDLSNELALKFKNPTIQTHRGGHYVPQDKQNRTVVSDFIAKFSR
jgi:predicted esterase